jgi:hypothetical protein
MSRLFLFASSVKRDPLVNAWMLEQADELGAIAKHWFEIIRNCGDDVRELMHDGYPTACVGEAAFAYVGAFKHHVNVGFFQGAKLSDVAGLLEGTGKYMRHVKVRSGGDLDAVALENLVHSAYSDMKQRLSAR